MMQMIDFQVDTLVKKYYQKMSCVQFSAILQVIRLKIHKKKNIPFPLFMLESTLSPNLSMLEMISNFLSSTWRYNKRCRMKISMLSLPRC